MRLDFLFVRHRFLLAAFLATLTGVHVGWKLIESSGSFWGVLITEPKEDTLSSSGRRWITRLHHCVIKNLQENI